MRKPPVGGLASGPVSIAAALIVLLFVIAVSYSFYGERGAANQQPEPLAEVSELPTLEREYLDEIDTDGDGMPDWEEIFLGTDPNDPASVGKGAFDDVTDDDDEDIEIVVGDDETIVAPNSATRVAARELFGSYLYTLTETSDLSEAEQQRLVQDALQKSLATIDIPAFDGSTLTTVPVTPDSVKAYALHTKLIFEKLADEAPNEYQLLSDLTQGDQAAAIVGLHEAATLYTEQANRLTLVATPEDAVLMHADLIDSILKYAFSLEGIANINTDPMQTAVALRLLMGYDSKVRQAFSNYNQYFVNASPSTQQ